MNDFVQLSYLPFDIVHYICVTSKTRTETEPMQWKKPKLPERCRPDGQTGKPVAAPSGPRGTPL